MHEASSESCLSGRRASSLPVDSHIEVRVRLSGNITTIDERNKASVRAVLFNSTLGDMDGESVHEGSEHGVCRFHRRRVHDRVDLIRSGPRSRNREQGRSDIVRHHRDRGSLSWKREQHDSRARILHRTHVDVHLSPGAVRLRREVTNGVDDHKLVSIETSSAEHKQRVDRVWSEIHRERVRLILRLAGGRRGKPVEAEEGREISSEVTRVGDSDGSVAVAGSESPITSSNRGRGCGGPRSSRGTRSGSTSGSSGRGAMGGGGAGGCCMGCWCGGSGGTGGRDFSCGRSGLSSS